MSTTTPLRTLCSLLLAFAFACSTTPQDTTDPDAGSLDTSADSTDGATTDAGAADKWWTCSTWESAAGTKTPRKSGCETSFDDGTYGCKAPWYGFKHAGTAYTCNLCRGGDPLVQARWRAVDFNTEDPSKPLAGDHKEVLTIDGNTWHLRAEHTDKGVVHKVKVDGWYWCSDAAELKTASNVFHATAKVGSDFFGWFAPDLFTGLFLTKGKDQLAWSYNEGFETKKAGDALYCRIGSTIKGKPCTDPFK